MAMRVAMVSTAFLVVLVMMMMDSASMAVEMENLLPEPLLVQCM
jgi:hypothetical protein